MSRLKTMYGNVKVWGMLLLAILIVGTGTLIWLAGTAMVLAGGVLQRIGSMTGGISVSAHERGHSAYDRIRPKSPKDQR
ncbi:hypothetical protein Peetri_00061 [Pseudomonas phage vB_PpuM-Peetri]